MKAFINIILRMILVLPLAAATVCSAEIEYTNPVLAGDYPDPSIIRVGDDYWATATSSEWGPHYPLLHSRDLVNWEIKGYVFDRRPDWAAANFWAPEIAAHEGRYFIYYTARKKGGPLAVAVATADRPEGPYTDHGPIVAQDAGSIDAVPVTDEHGQRYLLWKEDGNSRRLPTIIWAQPLTDDGLRLKGEARELIRNDVPWEGGVVEGPFVVRRDGWFYLFYSGNGCCGTGCTYALGVARSKSLLGPWEKNSANPILAGNDVWKCPGHGSIVTDPQGRYFLLYHAYARTGSIFTGREGLLDEVIFGADGWPTIHQGKGPSDKAGSPLDAPQRRAELAFEDEFDGAKLRVGWQWPQAHRPKIELKADQGGQLHLAPDGDRAADALGAILARPTTLADYVATTILSSAELKPGTTAGLAAIGDSANAMGLAWRDGTVILWRRDRGRDQTLAEEPAPSGDKLHLRLVTEQGYQFHFAYSADGREWKGMGGDLEGKNLPPWDRSIRVALTAGGGADAAGVFDKFVMRPGQKP